MQDRRLVFLGHTVSSRLSPQSSLYPSIVVRQKATYLHTAASNRNMSDSFIKTEKKFQLSSLLFTSVKMQPETAHR